MFALPDDDVLYRALLDRSESFEGRCLVAVTSTRIFCRLTCPARKPKRHNCRFYATPAECLAAGFRPCKRCHPLEPAAEADATVQSLLAALWADPDRRWREVDVVAAGHDPSTVRRAFKRHFGMTFLEMARLTRLGRGFETMTGGGQVIDGQLDAGFESPSGFRAAFAKRFGRAAAQFTGKERLKADWIETPLGSMIAVADNDQLHLLEFADRKALPTELTRLRKFARGDLGLGRYRPTDQIESELERFFAADAWHFQTPLALHGSAFTKTVWQQLQQIPTGQTCSYGELAAAVGRPTASRAVARANGANQIAIVIPCHRVIGADGALTGYGGGLWRKQKLIELEQQIASGSRREKAPDRVPIAR